MKSRVRYQIAIPNPLLENIKRHYPMAWDMTLAAISSCAGKYTPYTDSENEIGFLVLHIGVGLERSYNVLATSSRRLLLVCGSNAMVRMIEELARKYPQIEDCPHSDAATMRRGTTCGGFCDFHSADRRKR